MMAEISDHACQRYAERIEQLPDVRAELMLHADIIDRAAAFGCDTIKLPNGARLKLKGNIVATVLPPFHEKISRRIGKMVARQKRLARREESNG